MRFGKISAPIVAKARFAAIGCMMLGAMLAGAPVRSPAQVAQESSPLVLASSIDGAIGPATAHHIERLVKQAGERKARALVLQLNTPGGLATSMREIIATIIASPVPVIGYVAPSGAHAASAGTYILYATHLAAMAPGTNLGAATPVQIGLLPGLPPPEEKDKDQSERQKTDSKDGTSLEEQGKRLLGNSDAMTAKATNDAVAFIRSLAELRHRNADWAETAVRQAASLSAAEALRQGVVDLVVGNIDELLQAANGRTATVLGREVTIATAGAMIERVEPDTITQLLGVISNPNVALVLMLLGIYGVIFEIAHPGAVAPGVIGGISLILGLYALNQLPLNYAGLALVILGMVFMFAEALTPSFGLLGFGGLTAFVTGAAMLIDTDIPAYQLSWPVIATMAGLSAAILIFLIGFTLRVYRRAGSADATGLIGAQASVLDWSGDTGHVLAAGERWNASGAAGLQAGQPVRIRKVDGLALHVGLMPTGETIGEKDAAVARRKIRGASARRR
jgi:membrane-bound serine protease (ClpP class)